MFYQQKATQVTFADPGADDELLPLAAFYAYRDGLDRPLIRANMVSSIDGSATVDDTSGGLGGRGDQAVFRVLRGLADVIVVGAGTALAEQYRQPQPDSVFTALRSPNAPDAPTLALVSRSLSIDVDYPPVSNPATLVITCASAPADRRAALAERGATLLDCGTDDVDPAAVTAALGDRGLYRVLCEGGPQLLSSLIVADVVDEMCVTTSPHLVAGDGPRIAHGPDAALRGMRLAHTLTDDDGFVFARWVRAQR